MVEILKSLSDDQIALVGCAAALMIAGTIMSLSYYIGRARTVVAGQSRSTAPATTWQASTVEPATVAIPIAQRRDAA
jgi:hypothetical protein